MKRKVTLILPTYQWLKSEALVISELTDQVRPERAMTVWINTLKSSSMTSSRRQFIPWKWRCRLMIHLRQGFYWRCWTTTNVVSKVVSQSTWRTSLQFSLMKFVLVVLFVDSVCCSGNGGNRVSSSVFQQLNFSLIASKVLQQNKWEKQHKSSKTYETKLQEIRLKKEGRHRLAIRCLFSFF